MYATNLTPSNRIEPIFTIITQAHWVFKQQRPGLSFAALLNFLLPIRVPTLPVSSLRKNPEKVLARSPFLCATVSNTMDSNTQAGHDPAELGELERSILSIVWRNAEITADQAREELGRPLKDSTIRTVLRRLEEKGYLKHSVEERTFIYRPAQSRQRVAGRAVKRIVDWFCEGSVEALLVGMVDSKVLNRA